jgi:hypothetical protein
MKAVEWIKCVDDDGKQYTVVKWQHYTSHSPLAGARERHAGSHEYKLDDGREVTSADRPYDFLVLDMRGDNDIKLRRAD